MEENEHKVSRVENSLLIHIKDDRKYKMDGWTDAVITDQIRKEKRCMTKFGKGYVKEI